MDDRDFCTLLEKMDPDSQFDYLLQKGSTLQKDPSLTVDSSRIIGCKTSIWFRAVRENGILHLNGWSESVLVRGVLAILAEIYDRKAIHSGEPVTAEFIHEISPFVIYEDIKQNGLTECISRLRKAANT